MVLTHRQIYSEGELVAGLELDLARGRPKLTRTTPSVPVVASTESTLVSAAPYLNNHAASPATLV